MNEQVFYWFHLEFVWYQDDYRMLLPNYYMTDVMTELLDAHTMT